MSDLPCIVILPVPHDGLPCHLNPETDIFLGASRKLIFFPGAPTFLSAFIPYKASQKSSVSVRNEFESMAGYVPFSLHP
jgi:hypothetical protein